MTARDLYKVLHVDPDAHSAVIDAAYRTLARIHHPDLAPGDEAQGRMAELNAAYATLRDPVERAAYDKRRRAGSTATATPATPPSSTQRPTAPTGPGPAAPASGPLRSRAASAPHERDAMTVDFGRYAGWTLESLARHDPAYLEWLKRHSSGMRYRQRIDALLQATTAGPAPEPASSGRRWRR